MGPDGWGLAVLDRAGQLQHCAFYSRDEGDADRLQQQIDALDLAGMSCSLVLHPVYYQLLLAEAPPVEPQEVGEAVRWKIKELLDFPLEQAAIDYFLLPADAYRGRQSMLYAAAMRRSALQQLVEPVEQAGLALDCIEIAELAMHNLISRLPEQSGGTALVQLMEGGGFINLVEDGAVYLSRRLDVGLDEYSPAGDNQRFFEALYLDIQRSLDFYESQLGKGIITRLLYSPGLPETAGIGEFLSRELGLEVSVLDLSPLQLIDVLDEERDEQMARSAMAIGAALGPQRTAESAPEASRAAH